MPGSAVSVESLSVAYGVVTAVRDAYVHVPARGVAALVGPSGCGKTSLLRAVAGFEAPVSGRVRIGDRVVCGDGVWVPPEKRHVGMVFQQGALFPHLTVRGNVGYGLAGRDDADAQVAAVLHLVGIAEFADRYPDELSGGQQQRVALARALAPEPSVVLLDEPFSGLDAVLRERLREEVRSILEQASTTAIMVTHDQEEALSFADTVAVMSGGRILQQGTPDDLYANPVDGQVARIVGDGQLLDCRVRDGRVSSLLGSFPTDLPDGPAKMLIRPEDLLMFWATEDDQGPRGTVVRRRFFGHDIIEDVRVEDGTTLSVRLSGSSGLPVGTPVRLRLRHTQLRVFPDGVRPVAGKDF